MSTPAAYIQAAAAAALNGPGTFARTTRERATLIANTSPMPLVLLYPQTEKTTTSGVKEHTYTTQQVYFCDTVPGAGDDDTAYFEASDRMFALKNAFLSALYGDADVQGAESVPADQYEGVFEAQLAVVGITVTVLNTRTCL